MTTSNLKRVLNDTDTNITDLVNCMEYALQFWNKDKKYKIWYNGDHVINIPNNMTAAFGGSNKYRPLEDYGFVNIVESFQLTDKAIQILKEYFQNFNKI